MAIRNCVIIGAVALILAIGSASAFACGAGHRSAHASTATKVSYVAPSASLKRVSVK